MGLMSNKIDRQELKPGDHIYCRRQAFIYAHHGIYVGDRKVIHFTQGPAGQKNGRVIISSCLPDPQFSDVPCPQCGDRYSSFNNGVILSCIDCFLSGGELKLFEYGVSRAYFLANVRGGTCTLATSDPPEDVLHRANILLENGFGDYDVFKNNCEDFAIYCKTGLLVIIPSTRVGQSGQVAALEATSRMVFSSLALLSYKFKGVAAVGSVYYCCSGVYYCYSRLNSDIGVRCDVAKVAVESLVPPAPMERLVPPAPAPVSYGNLLENPKRETKAAHTTTRQQKQNTARKQERNHQPPKTEPATKKKTEKTEQNRPSNSRDTKTQRHQKNHSRNGSHVTPNNEIPSTIRTHLCQTISEGVKNPRMKSMCVCVCSGTSIDQGIAYVLMLVALVNQLWIAYVRFIIQLGQCGYI